MSKVNSTIQIHGSIGNLSLYTLNGKQIVRQKGGPSKSQIMKKPTCRPIKENMNEFGAASHIAKIFRMSRSGEYKKFGSTYISGRLTCLFKHVCSASTGIRGQRSFEFSKCRDILEDFEFNENLEFIRVFRKDCTVGFDPLEKRIVTEILPFNPKRSVSSPKNADHMKFFSVSSVMSDYYYDTDLKRYKAVHPDLNGMGFISESTAIELKDTDHSGLQIINEPGAGFELPEEAAIISSVGVIFYQQIGDKLFELKDHKAMQIKSVFIC